MHQIEGRGDMSERDAINEHASEQLTCCSECDDCIIKDELDSSGMCACCSLEHYCIGCGSRLNFVGYNGDDSDLRYAQEIWECPQECEGWLMHIELCKQARKDERKQRQSLSEMMQCITNTATF